MIEQIESALATFFAGQLASGTIIRRGSDMREKPVGERLVIAAVRDVPHDAGALYRGMLTLLIQTPIVLNADGTAATQASPDDHGAFVTAVEAAINPRINSAAEDQVAEAARVAAVKQALDTAMQAAAGFACPSTYCQGPQSARDERHWITTIEVVLGLRRL